MIGLSNTYILTNEHKANKETGICGQIKGTTTVKMRIAKTILKDKQKFETLSDSKVIIKLQ